MSVENAQAGPAELTEEEYKELEAAAPANSSPAWNKAVDAIKKRRGGKYPPDWFAKVLMNKDKFGLGDIAVVPF